MTQVTERHGARVNHKPVSQLRRSVGLELTGGGDRVSGELRNDFPGARGAQGGRPDPPCRTAACRTATLIAPLLRRRGLRCVFFVITDLIDNQVLFRESAASLCIEAILRMPFEQVESIMAELGLGAQLRPRPNDAALI